MYRKAEVQEFIARWYRTNGYGPTLREIAEGVGLSAVATARHHVRTLEEQGTITCQRDTNGRIVGRSIRPAGTISPNETLRRNAMAEELRQAGWTCIPPLA